MATKTVTVSHIATRIVDAVNGALSASEKIKALAADCAKMGVKQKREVDSELVTYYASVAGVGVKVREDKRGKVDSRWCAIVACWDKTDDKKLTDRSNKASVALSRARGILFPRESAQATPEKAAKQAEKKVDAAFKLFADGIAVNDEVAVQRVKALFLMLKSPKKG